MFKLESGENIIKIVRRHYFVILPMISMLMIFALLPIAVQVLIVSDFSPLNHNLKILIQDFVFKWKAFGYSLWLLILWVVFFIEWTDYYLDIWIITDRRIIDVEQLGFFHREVTSFKFEQIQDITIETKGLIETLFKFGTLHIQTAGHSRDIIIKDAHRPEDARSLILDLSQKIDRV